MEKTNKMNPRDSGKYNQNGNVRDICKYILRAMSVNTTAN